MNNTKKGKIVFDNAKGLVGAVPQGFEMEMEDDKIHYNKETKTTEVDENFKVNGKSNFNDIRVKNGYTVLDSLVEYKDDDREATVAEIEVYNDWLENGVPLFVNASYDILSLVYLYIEPSSSNPTLDAIFGVKDSDLGAGASLRVQFYYSEDKLYVSGGLIEV